MTPAEQATDTPALDLAAMLAPVDAMAADAQCIPDVWELWSRVDRLVREVRRLTEQHSDDMHEMGCVAGRYQTRYEQADAARDRLAAEHRRLAALNKEITASETALRQQVQQAREMCRKPGFSVAPQFAQAVLDLLDGNDVVLDGWDGGEQR